MSLLEVAAQIFARRCVVKQTGIIRENRDLQTFTCIQCTSVLHVDRRDWNDADRKLERLEWFKELHELCEDKRLKLAKTAMFSRPFRSSAVAGQQRP